MFFFLFFFVVFFWWNLHVWDAEVLLNSCVCFGCMLSVVLFSWLRVVFHSLGYWLMLVHFSNVFYGLIVVSFGVVWAHWRTACTATARASGAWAGGFRGEYPLEQNSDQQRSVDVYQNYRTCAELLVLMMLLVFVLYYNQEYSLLMFHYYILDYYINWICISVYIYKIISTYFIYISIVKLDNLFFLIKESHNTSSDYSLQVDKKLTCVYIYIYFFYKCNKRISKHIF